MKITIFGATGGVGEHLLSQAIAKGHKITAFARNPEGLAKTYPEINIVQGDILDQQAIKLALKESDAVICALGMPLMDTSGLRAAGTKNIIAAMKTTGVKRLICLSALGTGDRAAALPALHKYLLKPTVMRRLYRDHAAQENHVQHSDLDWTLVRPGSFIKGVHTGKCTHGFTTKQKGLTYKISRQDVADFLLRQLETSVYSLRAANISY